MSHSPPISRRHFLGRAAAIGGAGLWSAASRSRVYGANERLRVAAVGVGGQGWSDLTSIAASPHAEIVALCDVDESAPHLGRAAEKFPRARTFDDWRRLLDRANEFDAVMVSTPDHMHAPIGRPALQLAKHLFCQKPLTHTLFETRQIRRAAEKYGVVTQMCNQIQSHSAYRTAVQLVRDGEIGKVKEVHSWQSGPLSWLLVDRRPEGADPVPKGLSWDNWLGAAPERPYKEKIYHPFNWRAWQDFSNGQLGDFGCHILDPVFLALDLSAPLTVKADAPPLPDEVWTRSSRVEYVFPGNDRIAGETLKLTWSDGEGAFPSREALGLPEGFTLPRAGSVLIGEEGSLLIPHFAQPKFFPESRFADRPIEPLPSLDHYVSWVDACRGEGVTTSPFGYAGPLTESVLLGTVAIRVPGKELAWDSSRLAITNEPAADALVKKSYRSGWEPAWIS